jgi:hypothetical protein
MLYAHQRVAAGRGRGSERIAMAGIALGTVAGFEPLQPASAIGHRLPEPQRRCRQRRCRAMRQQRRCTRAQHDQRPGACSLAQGVRCKRDVVLRRGQAELVVAATRVAAAVIVEAQAGQSRPCQAIGQLREEPIAALMLVQ